MKLEECIEQLKDLRQDREDFLDGDFTDSPFVADIEAIDTALAAIEELQKAKRLLKCAVEDLNCGSCNANCRNCSYCGSCDYSERFKWIHTDEAMKLIGEQNDENN